MLPGFRFLFAALVLSISMLIFGLGAAALLRAAHEEFASIPSRRPPETMFAQRSDAGPVLAMLRAQPSAADEKADPPITGHVQEEPALVSAPAESGKPAAESDRIAALVDTATPPQNSSSSEAPTETAAPEIPIGTQAPSTQTDDAPSLASEAKVAAIAEMTATAPDQSATARPNQTSAPIDDSSRIAETRIATLGGPPVTIETQMPSKSASAVVKKQAKRVVKRRVAARRAPVALRAVQKPADPFGQPFSR
jgi:hypothetical protein